MKLFLKQMKQKNGEWVKNAEASYKQLQELHDSQVKEFGADNLTTVEAYTRVFGHRSGYVRGLGEGPPPLKSVKECGLNNISEADLNARIQEGVEQRLGEFCKKKEEEMEKRMEEFSQRREEELRKQLRAEMQLLIAEQMSQNTVSPTNQTCNPPKTSILASFDKGGANNPVDEYFCLCGMNYKDTESYMTHLRSSEHLRRMTNPKNTPRPAAVAKSNATIRRMKLEKKMKPC